MELLTSNLRQKAYPGLLSSQDGVSRYKITSLHIQGQLRAA
jgi:hypothetical protein